MELPEEDIKIIDEWLNILAPVRGSFNVISKYVQWFVKENNTGVSEEDMSKGNKIFRILKETGLIEQIPIFSSEKYRFTPFGEKVYQAGGWKQYHQQIKVAAEFQAETNRLAKKKLEDEVVNVGRVRTWFIPATITAILGGLLGAATFVIKLSESDTVKQLKEREITQDSLLRVIGNRVEVLSDSLTKHQNKK